MSVYSGNRPSWPSRPAEELSAVNPPDVPFTEERVGPAHQFARWLKSDKVRDKANAALKYAEKHPRQMMVASLALGLMVGALRRKGMRHAGNGV